MEFAARYGVYQSAVGVVPVDMRPAVPFGPVQQLFASVDESRLSGLDVGVHLLGNDRAARILIHVYGTQVYAFQIAAGAREVEGVFVTHPDVLIGLVVSHGIGAGFALYVYRLVLESAGLDDPACLGLEVEQVETGRRTLLAGHLI